MSSTERHKRHNIFFSMVISSIGLYDPFKVPQPDSGTLLFFQWSCFQIEDMILFSFMWSCGRSFSTWLLTGVHTKPLCWISGDTTSADTKRCPFVWNNIQHFSPPSSSFSVLRVMSWTLKRNNEIAICDAALFFILWVFDGSSILCFLIPKAKFHFCREKKDTWVKCPASMCLRNNPKTRLQQHAVSVYLFICHAFCSFLKCDS